MSLNELSENTDAVVSSIDGDTRFVSRITSIGLTPGCKVTVVKNDRKRPILIYTRDTMIALNKDECSGIQVIIPAHAMKSQEPRRERAYTGDNAGSTKHSRV